MLAPHPTRPDRKRRRGAAPVEMLLILPVFLGVIFGMAGLADLLVTEQLLSEASARGARTAALGGTKAEIEASVKAVLGPNRSTNMTIVVTPPLDSPIPPGSLIEVRVEVKAGDATATRLFPIRADEQLVGRTVMQKE